VVEGEGRNALVAATAALDCGNSGTTMRLLAGVLASAPFPVRLTGDVSLLARPMERVAMPLREMGATVRTNGGRAPIEIEGGVLRGIVHELAVASAQVKGAVLLAGLAATGETSVVEPAATRDHTERALEALGAPVRIEVRRVTVAAFRQGGFEGAVPGDVSAASFLVAAAALSGTEVLIHSVGLNPSRTRFLDVMQRMGVRTERTILGTHLGEPVGDLHVLPGDGIEGTQVEAAELPLVIDEVPVLAALAAHAKDHSLFAGAAELRTKESDRLDGLAAGMRALGGLAEVQGNDLLVAGGGLTGGSVDAGGDHRMAMALTVAALAASGPSEIEGMESAEVSFPGFVATLARLGAWIEG
jgi:3-phosphoshikimate 1-carboxyvinyltransferase